MNRTQKINGAMIMCAIVVIGAVLLAVSGIFRSAGYTYASAEKYTAGEADITDQIRNLDIDWIDGEVNIAFHNEKGISLRETSAKTAISEDMKLRWWVDGDTLRIRYAKPGLRLTVNPQKQLTVTLPEGISLNKVSVGTTSGDIHIPALQAEELALSSTSGDVQAEAEARTVKMDSTSGDQRIRITGEAQSIRMSSTSGGESLEIAGQAESVTMNSTSGNMEVQAGAVGTIGMKSTSGTVRLKAGKADKVQIDSTSGSVTAALPEAPGFTARITTTSGKVDSAMALTKNGDEYTCGDGSGTVKISTTSGDVRIEAWEK